MDPQDYSSHYSGQSYSHYGTAGNPHGSSAGYQQQYYHTSSGSEQGGYDYDAASPTDDAASSTPRSVRGGSSATSGNTSTSARRREQNRLAQRALRQRRESHIRTLEDRILHTSLHTRHLATENRDLSSQLQNMTLENDSLRQTSVGTPHAAATGVAGVPAYDPYAHHGYAGGAQSAGYGGAAYNQSAYSAPGAASGAGDPRAAGGAWPYEAGGGQYQCADQRYWAGQQQYAGAYTHRYGQYEDDGAEDESEEEEEPEQRPSRVHRRRR